MPPRFPWARWPDERLLDLPLKALKLTIEGTWLEDCLGELHAELAQQALRVRPHAWLAEEWFSPDNTPGIAVPFYLAHPRLMKLERRKILEVEGGTQADCMRILRHEAGHVIQHAFQLHRRRRWQQVFGCSSQPYPDSYRPNPASKNYVQHLRMWYAQSHPDEDFAETFAVWLKPRSDWRRRYAEWPALRKLLYVDELMQEIAGSRPLLTRRVRVDPLSRSRVTLREHYAAKQARYLVNTHAQFDRDLLKIFSADPRDHRAPTAAQFLRRHRAQLRQMISRWTGEYQLTLDTLLDGMGARARDLRLRAPGRERQLLMDLAVLLATRTVHSLYSPSRREWFAL
ncbi:MAG: putative zinc-binding metallopeptidase [Gammaproteobacteria bacterium]